MGAKWSKSNLMKKLWKFEWYDDYAFIGGLFCATDEEVKNLIGKHIYLGEYEGKHSEVHGTIDKEDIILVSDNPIVVETVGDFGINPLWFLEEE